MKKLITIGSIAFLLTIALVFMLGHLNSDPPLKLSDSQGLNFDPPSKCHSARNRVLFGKWDTDEWDPYLHSPVHAISQALVFSLIGVGFAQMRVLPVLVTAGSLLLLYFIVAHSRGRAWALLCLGLAALCYPLLIFGRSGLLEPYLIFFMLLSAWLLIRSYQHGETGNERKSRAWFACAASAAALAFLSKPIAGYFVIAFLVTVLAHPPLRVKRSRLIALTLAVLPVLLYLLFSALFVSEHLSRESGFWLKRAQMHRLGSLWIHQPVVVKFSRWLLPVMIPAVFGLYIVHWIFLKKRLSSKEIAPLLMAVTFLLCSQFLAFVQYRPMRYYFPLLAPALILSVTVISGFYRWLGKPAPLQLTGRFKPLFWWVIVSYGLKFCLVDFMVHTRVLPSTVTHAWRMIIAAAVAAALVLSIHLFGKYAGKISRLYPPARKALFFIIFIPILYQYFDDNVKPLRRWFNNPRYTQYYFSLFAARHLKDAVLAGPSPEFAVMENRFRAVKVTDYNLNWKWMHKDRITHLVIPETLGHIRQYKKLFPDFMNGTRLLEHFEISGLAYKLLAAQLEPVVFSLSEKQGPNSIVVTARNPDRYSYQPVTLLSLVRDNGGISWINVDTALCDPRSTRTFEIMSREASEMEIYAVGRHMWRKAISCPTRNAKITEDIQSPSLRVIEMDAGQNSIGTLQCGYTEKPGFVAAAVTLKLKQRSPSDKVTLSWVAAAAVVERIELAREDIPSDRYVAIVLSADLPPESNPELRLRFEGEGKLLISDVLAINLEKGYLEDSSEWHKTIAAGR